MPGEIEDDMAKDVIMYLEGHAFDHYFREFTKDGALIEYAED